MDNNYKFGPVKYNGTNDHIAKLIWSKPNHFKVLVDRILGLSLNNEQISYISNEDICAITGKNSMYDIIVKYNDDIKLMLETQNDGHKTSAKGFSDYMINRTMCYVSKVFSSMYQPKTNYKENKYTFLIWICNFEIPNKRGVSMFTLKNDDGVVFDRIKIAFISLPNIENDGKINCKTKEFLSVLTSNDMTKFSKTEGEVMELAKTINDINKDPDQILLAELAQLRRQEEEMNRETDREEARTEGRAQGLAEGRTQGLAEGRTQGLAEGRTQGLAEGRTQGLAEGKAEGKAEIALNMLKSGMSKEDVSRYSGIPIKDLEKII